MPKSLTTVLLRPAQSFRRALSVLIIKGPAAFLAEAWLRLRMRLTRRYVTVDGCRFNVQLLPRKIVKSVLTNSYEVSERRALAALDGSLPLIECGGGFGIVACLANRRLRDPTQHVVLEANPALIPVLARHAALNGCGFQVVHGAIGYTQPTTEFYVSANPLASSRERRTRRQIEVHTVTLNALLAPYERVNVICDIEGTEVELIENEHAAWRKVQTLVLEVHEELVGAERIRTALATLQQRHGFHLVALHGDVGVLTARTP